MVVLLPGMLDERFWFSRVLRQATGMAGHCPYGFYLWHVPAIGIAESVFYPQGYWEAGH